MNYYTKTDAFVATFLEQIRQRNTKSNKTAVYRHLLKFKGSTKDDLIKALKMPHQTVTSRISVLMDLGIVEVMALKAVIGNSGSTFHSQFMVQKDKEKIKFNQRERRIQKWKRLKNQINTFDDIVPAELLESINIL